MHDIVQSYSGTKTVLELEINQGYVAQHETWPILQPKFFEAPAGRSDTLIYEAEEFNVNVHIRRRMKVEPDHVWAERGLDNDYYASVLQTALAHPTRRQRHVELIPGEEGSP